MSDKFKIELHASELAAIFDRGNARIIAANQAAASYGQHAIKSALVLNSGGLFAGAALMGAVSEGGNIQSVATGFYVASAFFVAGIIAAAVSSYFARQNQLKWIEWIEIDSEIKALGKTRQFNKEFFEKNKMRYLDEMERGATYKAKIDAELDNTNYCSIILATAAYLVFVVACLIVGGTMATV